MSTYLNSKSNLKESLKYFVSKPNHVRFYQHHGKICSDLTFSLSPRNEFFTAHVKFFRNLCACANLGVYVFIIKMLEKTYGGKEVVANYNLG